ncbi:MAG: tail fiber domain-containing protein [Bacteroidetes bacterium]|nr:tail fiber domain-containing protein [Bacteroidota bacterium]
MKTLKTTLMFAIVQILIYNLGFGQSSIPGNSGAAGDYLGWDNLTAIPLDIRHNNTTTPQNIDFYTDNTLRMSIVGNTGFNNGFVGIGSNLGGYVAAFQLDVENQINVNFDNFSPISQLGIGYHIGGNMVLQIPGISNVFAGTNSGSNWISGQGNTFLGDRSGLQNTTGNFNTFIGQNAGVANDVEEYNTFVGSFSGTNINGSSNSFFGHHSGFNAVGGSFNTFIGEHAGFGSATSAPIGDHNTFVGNRAGQGYFDADDNTIIGDLAGETLFSGSENAFLGNLSGRFNTLGSENTFIGFRAGQNNIDGTRNTLLGHQTVIQATPPINNGTALGASASVVTSNTMILGDNTVNVGIGLSGAAGGPLNKLEINADPASFAYTGIGGSGLKFRQLISTTPPVAPNGRVLTVDVTGNVVLTDDIGGNGSVTTCGGLVPANQNFITRFRTITGTTVREICTSQIYDDGTTVGIGVGSTVDNAYKTQIRGDVLIEHPTGGSTTGDIYMTDNIASNKLRVFAMHGSGGREALSIGPGAGGVGITNTALTGVYIGRNAGSIVDDDIMNTFVGNSCGLVYNGTAGEGENTFVGFLSGSDITTGEQNTFIGTEAAPNIVTGSDNVYIGQQSGNDGITTANENVVIGRGYFNGTGLTTSSNSILIGNAAHVLFNGSTFTNSVSIGHANRVACENCFTIASQDNSVTEQQVGIGFNNPSTTIGTGSTGGQEAKLYVDDYNNSGVAAYFNGSVYTNAGVVTASDAMFKDNVQPISNATTILNQLEPKTYNYKTSAFPGMSFLTGTHYGFIAQEVEAVLPGLVTTMVAPAVLDDNGNIEIDKFDFKAVNYEEFIPIMFGAMKEMQTRIDNLELSLNQCCNPQPRSENPGSSTINRSSIALSNHEIIILNQNSPNPFKDKTEITYILPESVKDAVILFYDHSGKVLQKFDISHRGAGSLTVYGEDLTSGVYTYSLIIDGENHQTKRMVKQ